MSMRISDVYLSKVLMRDVHRNQSQLLRLQRMASSLHRVNSYADDPRAVGAIQRYRSLIQTNAQYQRNASRSRIIVEATDSALQDISALLADARALILQEASALGNNASQDQAANVVDSYVQRLMENLNAVVEGNYLFGGHHTQSTPFVLSGDQVAYQGDDGSIPTQIGPHTHLDINIAGNVFVGANSAVLHGAADMAPRLTSATSLDALNLGVGWQAGAFQVVDGNGNTYTIDLDGASTVADVLDRIDSASSGALSAAIHSSGTSLQIAGTGPLTILEYEEGTTAQSLGLGGAALAGLLVGADIRTAPSPTTPLSEIPALAGQLPLGTLRIQIGETQTDIPLAAATTIADLQGAINTALPDLELEIDGAVLGLVSGSSESFTVSSAPGGTAASDLGLSGTGSPARLFGVMSDLKAALLSHDKVSIRATLAEIGVVEDLIQGQLTVVGSKQNTLDWAEGVLLERDERLQASLSREWDADLAQVATDLSRTETAYESALLVTSRLFSMNLMQYLR